MEPLLIYASLFCYFISLISIKIQ